MYASHVNRKAPHAAPQAHARRADSSKVHVARMGHFIAGTLSSRHSKEARGGHPAVGGLTDGNLEAGGSQVGVRACRNGGRVGPRPVRPFKVARRRTGRGQGPLITPVYATFARPDATQVGLAVRVGRAVLLRRAACALSVRRNMDAGPRATSTAIRPRPKVSAP